MGRHIPIRHSFLLILVDTNKDMRNKMNLPKTWLCTGHPLILLLKTRQELSMTHVTKTFIPWPWSLTCICLGCRASSLPRSSSTARQFDPLDRYRPCPFLHLRLCSGCVLSLGRPLPATPLGPIPRTSTSLRPPSLATGVCSSL